MAVRLVALAVTLVLAAVVALVVVVFAGPPSVEELREEAGLDKLQFLEVGVKQDQPGVAALVGGRWTGFDIDIAYLIAEDLGFQRGAVRFVAIESEDRARMQGTDSGGRVPVNLVIASYSITPAREELSGVTFSAPYLFTEQSVLTKVGHEPVSSLEDLRGRPVCTLSTATSEAPIRQAGVDVHTRKTISECFRGLDKGEFDAISTDAAILAGYKYRFPEKYTHWDIGLETTEAWGVNVGENDALRQLVNLSLYRSLEDPKDDRWEKAFEDNLGVEVTKNGAAPIAVAQQPAFKDGEVPKIRQWPWERVGP